MNKFPCVYCGQRENEYFHTLEAIIASRVKERIEAMKCNEMDKAHLIHYSINDLIDQGFKQGWDGHNYTPLDNLRYLEMKSLEKEKQNETRSTEAREGI